MENSQSNLADVIQQLGYVRIGTNYYKLVERPNTDGSKERKLIAWTIECIKADNGKDFLAKIPKLDGFCLFPNHFNFQKVVGNFYNLYHEFSHTPIKGTWQFTQDFLLHIFGEHYELGLDYLKLLLERPLQKLPILCLVSKERNTGKTTFLNYLKAIFEKNMTLNTNEEFSSNFNDDWVSSLIIAIDETFLERKQDSERIKNLSTALKYKSEAKGKDRNEIDFFAKFILCSNNEDNFVYIEPNETRYWIRKIEPFEKENINLLSELKKEISHFLHFLTKRPLSTTNETRMWFKPSQIRTRSLLKLIRRNRSKLELEMLEIIQYLMDVKNIETVSFCTSDMLHWLTYRGMKNISAIPIKQHLQNEWNLKPSPNSNAYTQFSIAANGNIYERKSRGRFYQISHQFLLKLDENDEM
jgi:Family of unknown function (DUF5906)